MNYLDNTQANDKTLVTELAGQTLHQPITSVEPLGGLVSHNYEINHKWIFKLPAKGTRIDDWEKQAIYMPRLQEQLKYQIPVPTIHPVHLSKEEANMIVAFCYQKIMGEVIQRSDFHQKSHPFKIRYFESLTEALEQLHLVHPNSLPVQFPTKMDYVLQFLFRNSPIKSSLLKNTIQIGAKLSKMKLENPILCHSDLHPENVCINGKGEIQGIIDFDTLTRGDYWMEFSPHLYRQKDLQLWQQIYNHHSQHPISQRSAKYLTTIGKTILLFHILGLLSIPIKHPKRPAIRRQKTELIDIF